MLDLEQVRFQVDTKALDDALAKLGSLGTAVENLGKVQQKQSKVVSDASKEIAKSSKTKEEAAESVVKSAGKIKKANEEAGESTSKLDKLVDKLTQRHQDMATGFTKGESSILHQARSLGALGASLNPIIDLLQKIGELSKDPFDSSLGSVRNITAEFERLQQRANLVANGIGLTTKQLREFSRISVESRGKVLAAGIDEKSIEGQRMYNDLLLKGQFEYIKYATAVNNADKAEKDRIVEINKAKNASENQAAALAKVTRETEKLEFATSELAKGLNLGSQNKMFAMRDQLKAAGIEGAALETQLQRIKQLLIARQGKSELSNIAKDAREARSQVDHLSRAIGVQLGDVGVSLASGQNPLTVLIQQGDQLRFAIANAKDAGQDLSKSMHNAIKGIATSFIDTGKVMGGFFVSSINQAAEGFTKFFITNNVEKFNGWLSKTGLHIGDISGAMKILNPLASAALGTLITLAIAATVALYQATKQSDELARSVNTMGAYFGAGADEAMRMATAIHGITDGDAVEVIKGMIEGGNLTKESFEGVATAAVNLEKYAGIAIDKTVEKFNKIKEDPVKAMIEVAKQTGYVTAANIEAVYSLDEMGNKADAVKLATDLMASALNSAANDTRDSLSVMTLAWITVKEEAALAWKEFKNDGAVTWLINAFKLMAAAINGTVLVIRLLLLEMRGLISLANPANWFNLDALDREMEQQVKSILDSHGRISDAIWDEAKAQSGLSTEQKRNNAINASGLTNELSLRKKLTQEVNGLDSKDAKRMSRNDYIQAGIKEEARLHDMTTLSVENLALATEKYGKKWDDAQSKQKKNPVDDYIERTTKSINDMALALVGATNEEDKLTKAAAELEKIKQDPKFLKIPEQQRKEIEKSWFVELQRQDLLEKQVKIQKYLKDLEKDRLKFNEDLTKLQQEIADATRKNQQGIDEENNKLELRANLIGLTEEQAKSLTRYYEEQAKIQAITTKYAEQRLGIEKKMDELKKKPGADIAEINRLEADLAKISPQLQAEIASIYRAGAILGMEEAAAESKAIFSTIKGNVSDVISAALFDGGKEGAKKLKDVLKASFRKFTIDVFINPISGAVSNFALSALGFGNMATAQGGVGSGIGSTLGSVLGTSALGAIGSSIASGFAATMTGQSVAAAASAYSAAGMSGVSAGLTAGAAMPYVLAAVAAYKILSSGGETRSGATYDVGPNGLARVQQGPSGGEIQGADAQNLFNATQASITGILKAVGSSAILTGFTAGLESSENGKGFNFAGGFLNGKGFGEFGGRTGGQFEMRNQNNQEAFDRYRTELGQSIIEALQVATDVPTTISKMLKDVDAKKLTEEATNSLIKTISTVVDSVTKFREVVKILPFGYLKDLSFDASVAMIEAAGGVENLAEKYTKLFEDMIGVRIDLTNTELDRYKSLKEAAVDLSQFVKDLLTGANSPLSASSKLNRLYSQFTQELASAESGNVSAFSSVKDTASSLLEQAKAQSTSALDYARTFYKVTGDLESLGANTDDTATIMIGLLEKQLFVLQDQLSLLRTSSSDVVSDIYRSTISGLGGTDLSSNIMSASGELRNILQVVNAYSMIGRTGIGLSPNQIDQQGFDSWLSALNTGTLSNSDFMSRFTTEAIANGATFNTAAGNTDAVTLNEVLTALEDLGIKLTDLNASAEASVVFNAKTAKILDAVSQGGTALTTTPA